MLGGALRVAKGTSTQRTDADARAGGKENTRAQADHAAPTTKKESKRTTTSTNLVKGADVPPAEGHVKVVVRVRPSLKSEAGGSDCVAVADEQRVVVRDVRSGEHLQYSMDRVYGAKSAQVDIYRREVAPLLPELLHGHNATVFAYGMTGSGKTYTMQGKPHSERSAGVIPRAMGDLLHLVHGAARNDTASSKVWVSYMEVYRDKVHDLLARGSPEVAVREDAARNIVLPGLTQVSVKAKDDFLRVYARGCATRTTAATRLNADSSRSHAVLLVRVQVREDKAPFRLLQGKLHLIDLAGSEDNRRTGNKGARMTESCAINSSLFVLGKVIDALNAGSHRVPYRDSKLTRLLSDSLGGSARSVMIANVAPGGVHFFHTYNTLNYATKSRQIVNTNAGPTVLDDPSATVPRSTTVRNRAAAALEGTSTTSTSTSTSSSASSSSKRKSTDRAEALLAWKLKNGKAAHDGKDAPAAKRRRSGGKASAKHTAASGGASSTTAGGDTSPVDVAALEAQIEQRLLAKLQRQLSELNQGRSLISPFLRRQRSLGEKTLQRLESLEKKVSKAAVSEMISRVKHGHGSGKGEEKKKKRRSSGSSGKRSKRKRHEPDSDWDPQDNASDSDDDTAAGRGKNVDARMLGSFTPGSKELLAKEAMQDGHKLRKQGDLRGALGMYMEARMLMPHNKRLCTRINQVRADLSLAPLPESKAAQSKGAATPMIGDGTKQHLSFGSGGDAAKWWQRSEAEEDAAAAEAKRIKEEEKRKRAAARRRELDVQLSDAERARVEGALLSVLNVADKKTLLKLVGIGAKRADSIVEFRGERAGGFSSISELKWVGLGPRQIHNFVIQNRAASAPPSEMPATPTPTPAPPAEGTA